MRFKDTASAEEGRGESEGMRSGDARQLCTHAAYIHIHDVSQLEGAQRGADGERTMDFAVQAVDCKPCGNLLRVLTSFPLHRGGWPDG